MMESDDQTVEALNDAVAAWTGCVSCDLAEARSTQVWGRPVGHVRLGGLVIVGEAPGRNEDETGEAFVGRAGMRLDEWLDIAGIQSAFIMNTVLCRPPRNRSPKRVELKACWGRLFRFLRVLKPRVVLTVGRVASHWLLSEDTSMNYMMGESYRLKVGGFTTFVLPVYHPAFFLRRSDIDVERATIKRFELALKLARKVVTHD